MSVIAEWLKSLFASMPDYGGTPPPDWPPK